MSLLEFPIRRYPFTLIVFLCLAVLGWFAFANIPREEDPYFKLPAFFITTIFPGADPKDLERLVAKPIEDRIAELDDVKKIETTVVDGVASIALEFEADADADKKYDEVTREVNALRPELPQDISQIEIRKVSPGLVNIVELALVSEDAPYRELEDYARELERCAEDRRRHPHLRKLGIPRARAARRSRSETHGGDRSHARQGHRSPAEREREHSCRIHRSRRAQLSASRLRALTRRSMKCATPSCPPPKAAPCACATSHESSWDTQPWSYFARFNGKRAVIVTANQKDGYNILSLNERLSAAIDRFESGLPKRIKLERGFDQSKNVSARLSRLYTDFEIAIALVSLTLLPLGWRAAGIVMVSIPLSLAFGLTTLYFLGYSLNQISIAGFVVALGLLVDDSIVVVENIARHLREGNLVSMPLSPVRGRSSSRFSAVPATLIFAFVPLVALPGGPGKFIRVLPATVISAIVGSLLIALFIIPFIASRFLKENEDPHGNKLLQRVMGVIHRYYRPALHYCLARPKRTVAVAIGGSILLSAALVPIVRQQLVPEGGYAAVPHQHRGAERHEPRGDRRRACASSRKSCAKMPEVKSWFANIGHGNPQIYYNHIVRKDSANYGEIFVQLKE